ncbi:hypothetical protein TSUD_206700 [Trifolium subterraneum]|uniref:Uncharacterized protein n=1 Tax=Trifolium subterraneum TaxID=3900 RepID=A0A2Z6MY80_TRISU|nr:hypothetical protein TSUD_206700 [Trifolium subterraneum]
MEEFTELEYDSDASGYGWSWIVSRILTTCIAYSSSVTPAILLSELSQAQTLGDYWSSNFTDLYLHRRFYDLAGLLSGILKKGREVFLTVNKGDSYSLYAREVWDLTKRKQITLVDDDGVILKFFMWGEQILLANFFRVGSMLSLDKPYVASSVDCDIETSEEFCLEYGSATQLYLVPYIQHEEQVCVAMTPDHHQGSRQLDSYNAATQGLGFSQGTIGFSNYPFRSFVADLRDKMTGTSGEIRAKLHFTRFW